MPDLPFSVYLLVALALAFDLLNGFHDSSNIVATMIFSRALSGRQALAITAIAEFTGPFLFGVAVATTLGNEVLNDSQIGMSVILAALGAAIIWNLITWWLGIPSSSSHALVGGLIGAAVIENGFGVVKMAGLGKVLLARHFSAHRISRRFSRHAGGPLSRAAPAPASMCSSAGAGRYGGDACTFARDERRSKDDGHDHARARNGGSPSEI